MLLNWNFTSNDTNKCIAMHNNDEGADYIIAIFFCLSIVYSKCFLRIAVDKHNI